MNRRLDSSVDKPAPSQAPTSYGSETEQNAIEVAARIELELARDLVAGDVPAKAPPSEWKREGIHLQKD